MLHDDLRSAKVLIVDDELANARLLDNIVQHIYLAVLSDPRMPVLAGVGLYREIERRPPSGTAAWPS